MISFVQSSFLLITDTENEIGFVIIKALLPEVVINSYRFVIIAGAIAGIVVLSFDEYIDGVVLQIRSSQAHNPLCTVGGVEMRSVRGDNFPVRRIFLDDFISPDSERIFFV